MSFGFLFNCAVSNSCFI